MNKKNVILLSKGFMHPSLAARHNLRQCLKDVPGIQVLETRRIESLKKIRYPECAALVLYLHRQMISPAALDALELFVSSGGGILAVHSASASFKGERRYFDILGGRFVSHERAHEFTVSRAPGDEKIFAEMPPFSVKDELYIHQYDRGVTVHFVAGSGEPVAWSRMHGKGRVCYISLGHKSRVMKNPCVLEMLVQGLQWVISGRGGAR